MHILKEKERFSQSYIWELQRNYYTTSGIEAWRSGEVPHYLTSNPIVGKTYAELVLAFLNDLALKKQIEEPVYILELGAGHGRLCYHFLKHFEKYYATNPVPLPSICYILSDIVESNLTFLQEHPRLQPYIENGWIDFSFFDIENSSEINLLYSKKTIKKQQLSQPIIVIANYFFDSIPQDLFMIRDHKVLDSLISLSTSEDPATLETKEILKFLDIEYSYKELKRPVYPKDPILNSILDYYCQQVSDTHILFPHTGILGIEKLRQLSKKGLVLLTADKGNHFLLNLKDAPAPQLAIHGSFSLTVNYHAFKEYCTLQKGLALFSNHQPGHLNLGCMLLLNSPNTYKTTINAYEKFINDYGPDDYFCLKKMIEKKFDTLTFLDIMSILRLSGYDARIFSQMLPQLFKLLPELSNVNRLNLFQIIHKIWDTYYPLGEQSDLAFDLGCLLLALAFYKEAIIYFDLSIKIYGETAKTLFNMAFCYCLLNDFTNAKPIVEMLKANNPDNETIRNAFSPFQKELC